MGKANIKTVFLKNFRTYSEAMMAKELLEKNGIKCIIQKGDLNTATEFTSWSGDADMFVLESNFEKAKSLVKEFFEEK